MREKKEKEKEIERKKVEGKGIGKKKSEKNIDQNKKKSEGDPKFSFIATKSEIKEVLHSGQTLIVLMYKEALVSTQDLAGSLPSNIVSLLQDYDDVFPEELPPGLPPIRGIEHQIDFIPGASIPNRPAYRSNPEETKEIQR